MKKCVLALCSVLLLMMCAGCTQENKSSAGEGSSSISWGIESGGEKLTLEDVVKLSEEYGNDLSLAHFKDYAYEDIGSGKYIWIFEIDDNYMLSAAAGGMERDKVDSIKLTSASDGESIDIRYDDVREFIERGQKSE